MHRKQDGTKQDYCCSFDKRIQETRQSQDKRQDKDQNKTCIPALTRRGIDKAKTEYNHEDKYKAKFMFVCKESYKMYNLQKHFMIISKTVDKTP